MPPHTQAAPPAFPAPNEPAAAPESDHLPDGQPDGAEVSADTCAGVANLAPASRGGQKGRSGPPGHTHTRQHGGWRAGRELKELVRRSMDGRTSEAREVAEWLADLATDLGGADNLSTQQRTLAELAAQTMLQLRRVDSFIAGMSSIANTKRRQLYPIIVQRTGLVNTLRQLLGDLGLERQARDLGTYCSKCQRTYGVDYITHACPPASPPIDASAAAGAHTVSGGPSTDEDA